MAKLFKAQTLDDALSALSASVDEKEARGQKTLIFCEDKLTLLAERAVLKNREGTFLSEVTAFSRFLSGGNVLSKEGSVMLVASLIEEHKDMLSCFSAQSARAVYETIAQLAASRVDAELLRISANETEGALRCKLSDLAFLFEKYRDALREKELLDENGYLGLLPEKIASGALSETHVIFFGFPSFTKQAQEGILAALNCARSVEGIFLAGGAGFFTNEAARVFSALCAKRERVEEFEAKNSLEGDALRLFEGLFSPERLVLAPQRAETIRRFCAADEEEEMNVVSALIKMYVSKGFRYSDFVVLVPNRDCFMALEKAFGAFRIPFFADKKRKFSAHPFCKFVLSALSAAASGALFQDVDGLASNIYFGEDGAQYRNYLLKFGSYRGAVRREIKKTLPGGFREKTLQDCRKRMIEILALFPKKGTGREYVSAVRALWELSRGEEKTDKLKEYFTGAERAFLDVSPLDGVLREIESIAGGRVFSALEFKKTLESGLDALEISLIPPSIDAVLAGDLSEAKFTRARVVFATGLTDEVPSVCADTAVITDGEISRLKTIKVEIEPSVFQVNARGREALALNLCSFTDALYLSYPLKRGEKETVRGEILQDAEKLFEMPPMPDHFPFDCCEEAPAVRTLLSLKQGYETGSIRDKERFDALYTALSERYGAEEAERLAEGGEKRPVPEGLGKEPFSPTILEKYFECPYAGFVARVLKLREREERTLLDADAGNFVHAVLETCAKKFNEFESEKECRAFARAVATELLSSSQYLALSDTKEGELAAERLLSEGEEVAAAAFQSVAQSSFRVCETEGKIVLPELLLGGKTDRIDVSDDYVRIIDYKTGNFDDSAAAYYTGRKLQLPLYLYAASRGKKPAGAFYFPASDELSSAPEERFRMSGFFCGEDEVLRRMDAALEEGGAKSLLFEGKRDGKFTDKGMAQQDFEDFLGYSLLVAKKAEDEIAAGNIAPAPYEKACTYCKLKSLCGFTGTARKEEQRISCKDIVSIVRREKGEE